MNIQETEQYITVQCEDCQSWTSFARIKNAKKISFIRGMVRYTCLRSLRIKENEKTIPKGAIK